MKLYDYKLAEKMIQFRSDLINEASLGIEEDWFWTAETVYKDGVFTVLLDENLEIGGIKGSQWGTPSLYLQYKDGTEEMIPCCTGDNEKERPDWFSLGCLSEETQEWVNQVKTVKLVKM